MLEITEDQQLFSATTAQFLDKTSSSEAVRELAANPTGYTRSFWREGASLGWTSLLVPDELGGGTPSGDGVADLCLIAWQFGLHAAPGPLIPSNIVAAALARDGRPDQLSANLEGILSGDLVPTWVIDGQYWLPSSVGKLSPVQATRVGDEVRLNGVAGPIEGADGADLLLVVANEGDVSQYLIPAATEGVVITPLESLDLTRRFATVEFRNALVDGTSVIGEPANAGRSVAWLADLAVVQQSAETLGAMQWAFDATLKWMFSRYSFGRPLASYQALKHRLADLKMCLDAADATVVSAAKAVSTDAPDRATWASAAKSYVGRTGPEFLQDCVQLHGGLGVTFEHDLHLFLRRAATNRQVYGTPSEHSIRICKELEGRAVDVQH